jgi:mannose-6-phosphate isomerase-like protein (cupin superfamily)
MLILGPVKDTIGGDVVRVYIADLKEIGTKMARAWSPVDVLTVGDYVARLAVFEGAYHWHSHQDQDELFLVVEGEITIDTEGGPVRLKAGQAAVVPRGVEHRPRAEIRSTVLMFEPKELRSEGD